MLLFQGPRDQLLHPLQSVSGIVDKRQTMAILSNVLLEVDAGQLILLGTDVEIQIRTTTATTCTMQEWESVIRLNMTATWLCMKYEIQAMLARGASVDLHLPLAEADFLPGSVTFAKPPSPLGDRWRERFDAVKTHPATRLLVMPVVLGPTPPGVDPYERCNAWMLDAAFAAGGGPVRFVCLWDGGGGDGPGGTRHMVEEVRRRGGEAVVIDTTRLWSAGAPA